jgi:hypothetical protein
LKEYKDNGGEVKVNWSIKEWDEDMEMEVEDFAADSELDINMIKVS